VLTGMRPEGVVGPNVGAVPTVSSEQPIENKASVRHDQTTPPDIREEFIGNSYKASARP
jgi:hypothetical protein